jgi:hypothetical protein
MSIGRGDIPASDGLLATTLQALGDGGYRFQIDAGVLLARRASRRICSGAGVSLVTRAAAALVGRAVLRLLTEWQAPSRASKHLRPTELVRLRIRSGQLFLLQGE